MNWMFDTNAISALVHHCAVWEQFARRIDGLATDQRLISAITLSELQTMIAKAEAPEAKKITPISPSTPAGQWMCRFIQARTLRSPTR